MTTLDRLAAGNADRITVLKERRGRARTRSHRVACPACNEVTYRDDAPTDICKPCLRDLWGAQRVLSGEYKKGQRAGLLPIWSPNISHWFPYPHLKTGHETMPKKATFARAESSGRSLQALMVDIMQGLSEVLPCDPTSRANAVGILTELEGYYTEENKLFAMLPKLLVEALRDLWSLFQWHSEESYRQGFDAGHRLLLRMNSGEETFETFSKEIADSAKNSQERLQKIAAGKGPGRR